MLCCCYIENTSKTKISLWQIQQKKHGKIVLTTIQYILITGENVELGRETKKANIFPRSYVIKSEAEFAVQEHPHQNYPLSPSAVEHPLVSFKKQQQHDKKLLLPVNLHVFLVGGS